MRFITTLGALAVAAGGFALVLSPASAEANSATAPVAARAAAAYTIDSVHSSVLFRTPHMGISHTWGRFDKVSGTLQYDEKDPAACSIRIDVDAASVNTGDENRDKHLGNNDFFNAKQFPKISFASKKVSAAGAGKMKVEGELELLGVTKPVSFEITKVGEGDVPFDQSHRVGFDAAFTINRGDFGMKYALEGPKDGEVQLTVSLEAIRNK